MLKWITAKLFPDVKAQKLYLSEDDSKVSMACLLRYTGERYEFAAHKFKVKSEKTGKVLRTGRFGKIVA